MMRPRVTQLRIHYDGEVDTENSLRNCYSICPIKQVLSQAGREPRP